MEQEKRKEKADTLALLRSKIQELEGFKPTRASSPVSFDIKEIDRSLPGEILPLGAVHELVSHQNETAAAATGFMAAILGKISKDDGVIIWISKKRTVFPPGLARFGINTDRIVFVDLGREQEILWATEEALRTKGIASVVSEISDVDITATRRMQLAVEQSGVTGFLLRANPKKTSASSCVTSWRVRSLPTAFDDAMPGVGYPRWEIELARARNGKPGKWQVEWKESEFHLIKPSQTRSNSFTIAAVK